MHGIVVLGVGKDILREVSFIFRDVLVEGRGVPLYHNCITELIHLCGAIGELCGECRDGGGVSSLLNRCTTCNDASGLLILLLSETQSRVRSLLVCSHSFRAVVLDVGAFVLLLVIMKPFPSWTYPFIFYLQVLVTPLASYAVWMHTILCRFCHT